MKLLVLPKLITCIFAEIPIRFGQAVTQKYEFLVKYVTRLFLPSFDKMQNHNAQESIHASFKWYEKEVTDLFLSARSVVQYLIFQYDQQIFFIFDFILLIAY